MNSTLLWRDIPVTVRHSQRARRVWIKVHAGKGVEVVLPFRVFGAEVPVILERHGEWIAARLADLAAKGAAPGQDLVPGTVNFPLVDREFTVARETAGRPELRVEGGVVRLWLPPRHETAGVLLLQRWLIAMGQGVLVPLCRDVAAEVGIPIAGVAVRNQVSRWGSCSAAGRISLNAKLLFLSEDLARHVVLHELAHIEHRNHGPRFWACLRRLDPLTDCHETQLRHVWATLPAWSKWRP